MDNPPGRYLPSNFSIFDFFFGSQSGHTLVYQPNQNLKNTDTKIPINIEDSYFPSKTMVNNLINVNKMNLVEETKDTTDKSSPDEKKSNTRVAGMIGGVFDALTNVVAKITNFTSTINRSLSVTVVSSESFPTEYVVKPLTDSENFTNTDDSASLINTSRRYQNYIGRSHSMEAFNNLSPQRLPDVDVNSTNNYNMWNDNTHDYYCQQIDASDMQLAIEENFKVNQEHFQALASESTRQMENNQFNCQYVKDLALAVEESLKSIKINYKPCDSGLIESRTETQRKDPANKNLSKLDDTMESENDYVDLSAEQIFETRSCMSKKRSKSNNRSGVAQSLGKNRRRIPLRRSTAGQMKHRKEKSKSVMYSAIQNDLNTWEDDIIDSSDELCSIISSSDEDDNTDDQKKCSLNIENYVIIEKCALGDPINVDNIIDTPIIKDVIDEKLSENFNHSNKCVPSITEDYQQNLLPEKPVKPEISLVHDKDEEEETETESESESESETESESESEFESESSGESESEEDEDDNDYSDDDFIQFGTEDSNSSNSKEVRFNLEPTVHTIIKWDFAYRAARKGPWEQMARDRDRFRTRIYTTGQIIEPVLAMEHRDCIWRDRFAATD